MVSPNPVKVRPGTQQEKSIPDSGRQFSERLSIGTYNEASKLSRSLRRLPVGALGC